MTDLLVGCPVSHRAWILPRWDDHVAVAAAMAEVKISYVFVADPLDTFTLSAIEALSAEAMIEFVNQPRVADQRIWNHERYLQMVEFRNRLLSTVRLLNPDYFLSLDSDILLHPYAIRNLLESTDKFDVVGGKTYMTSTDTCHPSWAMLTNNGFRREEASGVFPVDVVMAIKLLTPAAYGIEYEVDPKGEDFGFSKNCRAAGLRLGVDARVASKHVMSPAALDKFDERCGF